MPIVRNLFPGYLIAVTDDPLAVEQRLLKPEVFARVLRQGDKFVPLEREEVELIGGFTERGDRALPMSRALKMGEPVVVTEGPLVGREALIKSVNRHKNCAMHEVSFCWRKMTTRLVLAVFSEPDAAAAKRAELYTREALRSA